MRAHVDVIQQCGSQDDRPEEEGDAHLLQGRFSSVDLYAMGHVTGDRPHHVGADLEASLHAKDSLQQFSWRKEGYWHMTTAMVQ